METPAAMEPLPIKYHELLARVIDVAEPDPRIRGLWLSGSLARGTADAGSDLDLVLAIADDAFDDFVDGWRHWLDMITPTLVANAIPGSNLVFYSLTENICRIDGVVEPVSRVPESPHRTRVPVIDRDGLDARVPDPIQLPGADRKKITKIIEEFWRIQAIFPAMINDRRDLYCAREGVHTASRVLYDLFVECNQPLPPMGAKQFRARLTPEQYDLLLDIPAYCGDRRDLIAADLAVCAAMNGAGRAAAEAAGAVYPERIAAAVDAHLREALTEHPDR